MIKAATTVRAVTIALLVAACGLVGVLSTVNTAATHGSIPKPVDVRLEPGNQAKQLVLSWGAVPTMPNGCRWDSFSRSFGKTGSDEGEDEEHHRGLGEENGGSHIRTNTFRYYSDSQRGWVDQDLTAGQQFWGKVILYARCDHGSSAQYSPIVQVTAKSPHSGPATGFSAVTGSAVNTIVLNWTNPSGPTVSSYEYKKKLSSDSTWPTSWTSTTGSATTLTISSLTGGSKYDIQFRVYTNSVPTKTLHASGVKAALVGRPATFTAASGDASGEVDLAWGTVPAATAYQYQTKKHSANTWGSWTAATTGSTSTSKTITGLEAGALYDFQVRATTASNNGVESALVGAAAQFTPTATAASGTTIGTIDMSITAPTDVTVTRHELRWKRASAGSYPTTGTGSWSDIGTGSAYTITGLDSATSYDAELRTVHSSGTAASTTSLTKSLSAITPADPPTGFAGQQGDAPGEIDISWTDPVGASITARQYRTKLSTDLVFGTSWSSAGSGQTHTVTGLPANSYTDIQLRIQENGAYSIPVTASNIASGIVPAPAGLTATQGTQPGEIDLAWTAPDGITPASYRYRAKKSSQSDYPNSWETISATATSKTLTELNGDVEYSIQLETVYRISGRTADSYSATVTASAVAKPMPPPTSPEALESHTPGVAVLQWVPPPEVTTHEVQYRYKAQKSTFTEWSQWQAAPGDPASLEVRGLEAGTPYKFQIATSQDAVGSSLPQNFLLQLNPAPNPTGLQANGGRGSITARWDTPETGEIIGHRYRYRKSSDDPNLGTSWSDWTHRDLTETDDQSVTIYDLLEATAYTFELVAQRGNTFSQAITATTSTWLNVPSVSRIAPTFPSHRVAAGTAITLEVDVFNQQGGNINAAIDAKTGLYEGVDTVYAWSDPSGAGTFRDPDNGRRVVYEAPDTAGAYTITVRIHPTGICTSDHLPDIKTDPCTTQITVNVTRDRSTTVLVVPPAIDSSDGNTNLPPLPTLPTPVVPIDTGAETDTTQTGGTQDNDAQTTNPADNDMGADGDLPDTGGRTPPSWLIIAGILSLFAGGILLAGQPSIARIASRRRKHR